MKSFLAAWRARVVDPVTVAAWSITSGLMGIAGPFGTFETLSPLARLFLWAALIGCGLVVIYGICECFKQGTGEARTVARDAKVSLMFAGVYAPITWMVIFYTGSDGSLLMLPLWETFFYVFAVTLAVMMLRRIIGVGDEPLAPTQPLILRRLDGADPAQITRLSVEDHYVHVHFTCGQKERLLMRFSDALREVDGMDGFQVHRSHWVARPAVLRAERENGRTFLVTSDAARVPVSRKFQDRAAEWAAT